MPVGVHVPGNCSSVFAIDQHIDIHRGAGGGAYNDAWMTAIDAIGWEAVSVDDLLDLREAITRAFKLEPPSDDYFTKCRGGK